MNERRQILGRAEEGQIAPERLSLALDLAGVLPGPLAWRRFLGRLLLGLGVIMIACAMGFFVPHHRIGSITIRQLGYSGPFISYETGRSNYFQAID
jgi:hypothetical protein